MITSVLAVAQNGVIGRDNDLPWPRLKADMRRFRDLTTGGIVVMGANTWRSLPKKLADRINVVVSRRGGIEGADQVIARPDAIPALAEQYPGRDIHVIGGATLYSHTAHLVETVHLTLVHRDYPGDARVDLDALLAAFDLAETAPLVHPDGDLPALSFLTYRRKIS